MIQFRNKYFYGIIDPKKKNFGCVVNLKFSCLFLFWSRVNFVGVTVTVFMCLLLLIKPLKRIMEHMEKQSWVMFGFGSTPREGAELDAIVLAVKY
jgi:hypothetical protein